MERNSWSWLRPGAKELEAQKKLQNEHYRVWRKPVYAVARGEVLEFAYDRPDNPNHGRDPCEFLPESQGVINGAGNYFNIRHGNEIVA